MADYSTKKLPKATLEINLSIPWKTISDEYEKTFVKLMTDVTVEGFRKGKAPRSVAEKNIPKDKIYDTMIRDLLPKKYEEIVKSEDLKPIHSPKIELVEAKENEEWKIRFLVPLKPEIDLKDYKDIVKKAQDEAKKPEIWTPGKDEAQAKADPNAQKEAALQAGLDALTKHVKVEVSDVIIDDEVQNRLMRLVEDLQKLGITIESYVSSRNTSIEELKSQFNTEISETYALEFILSEIAEKEKIQVEQEDLTRMMGGLKSDEEKKAFVQNAYYYASLLRKQKVLEYLMGL